MKKPVTIFALCTVLFALWATLFAQTTTGSSLITEMKAAVRNFTLAADLNPGATGLQSAPVWGKKTGDMLTAGEYNRILELVGQVGGGGGGFDIVDAKSEWAAWPVWTTKFATCPSGYIGVFWIIHYYRPISTGGNLYHGVGTCDWDSARTKCSATTVDAMISEWQVVASCIRWGSTGGGGTTESSTSWITFDGTTTTPTVKSKSGNISGIQRYTNSGSGVGRYEILFNPAMPNVNYAISANAQATSSGSLNTYICGYHDKTVNSVKITVCNITNAIDSPDVSVTVHK